MRQLLDGSDWEAGYFISESEYDLWTKRTRNLHNMLMDSARAAGITSLDGAVGDLMSATVPGCDRTVLLENGEIDDPYYGRNLERSSWSEKKSWAFRKRFRLAPEMGAMEQIRLRFEGIDYRAMIFLNGNHVVTHCGMFIPCEEDVSRLLNRNGDNLLVVIFEPAPSGKCNHQEEVPADFAAFHRMQCGFGWDWSRNMVPTGIWDSVSLIGSRTARVKDLHWRTAGTHVSLKLEVAALDDWSGVAEVSLVPLNFQGAEFKSSHACQCHGGSNDVVVEFDFPEAHFWNPVGYGAPDLYVLEVKLDGTILRKNVGFRDIEMRRNPGSPEGAYDLTFQINGKRIFARGANWVPVDLLPSRANGADYEALVQQAAAANLNMLRMWGGGLIEKDAFYDACDRYGIMVWQEFPHACSNYPKDGAYLAIKERESEQIIRKLRNHVALSLFCGGNEMQYYGEIPESPLYRLYARQVAKLCPGIDYHTSSPDASRPGERPHGPWHYMEHSFYNSHFRNFASEIGCNALPEAESLDRFIPTKELIPDGQSYRYHFTNLCRANDLRLPLAKFDLPHGDRYRWSQASMFAQADAAGYIFEHYRRLYPQSSGCLFWQFNDPWPTCGWSLVDYYKVPKMAVYRVANSCAPISFAIEDDSWCLEDGLFRGKVWFCSNGADFTGKVTLELWGADGKLIAGQEWSAALTAPVAEEGMLEADCADAGHGVVLAVLKAVDEHGNECFRGDRLYGVPDFRNAFRLPPAKVALERLSSERGVKVQVTNVGQVPVFALRLKHSAPVCWRNNYLSLAPGEVVVYEADARPGCGLSDDDKIELSAWNVEN